MRITSGASIVVSIQILFALCASAQNLIGGGQEPKAVPLDTPPLVGTFYSLTLKQPPFPFNPFPGLPVYALTNGAYVFDDREVDYVTLRQQQAAALAEISPAKSSSPLAVSLEGGGGGMSMLMVGSGDTNLMLSIPTVQNGVVSMNLINANTNEPYDLFSTTSVGSTNAWLYRGRMAPGQVSVSLSSAGSASTSYTTANTADSDGDTLPDAVETLVTQTNPNVPDDPNSVPPGSTAAQFLADVPHAVYAKSFQRNYLAVQTTPSVQGFGGNESWTRGAGGSGGTFEIESNPNTVTNWTSQVTWDGAGLPTPSTAQTMPPSVWWFINWHELLPSPPGDPNPYSGRLEDDTMTRVELATGGPALSTKSHWYRFTVTTAEYATLYSSEVTGQIPHNHLTLLNETPDSNGHIWKQLADNQRVDVTPSATAEHNNYTFNVSATKLKLKILRGTADVTDKHVVVWVGQPISLTAVMNESGFTASNCNWTVPGNTISNYVYSSIKAEVVTQFPKTNAVVNFYWIQDSPSLKVSVTAIVDGRTVEAQTTFEVRRPEATLRLTPKWRVEVSTTHCLPTIGGVYLLTGKGCTATNDVGMLYEYSLVDLKGLGTGYEFQLVQIATLDAKENRHKINNVEISREVLIRGLDDSYPYEAWAFPAQYGLSQDSPAEPLNANFKVYSWRRDRFECYLMFKPSGGIPVPLRQAEWGWKGAAYYQENPAGWVPRVPFEHPQPAVGANTYSHPIWTNLVQNYIYHWKTNQFWFVP